MAESQAAEASDEATTIASHVGKMSDRAIQRLVGGNAFLRGRIYARRNAVTDLQSGDADASCKVMVRQDEPIETQGFLAADGGLTSKCSCQAWRGPDGHCKHVAALLVALRDRERPPKTKQDTPPKEREREEDVEAADAQSGVAGGKRRRSRRRRRGGQAADGAPAVVGGPSPGKIEVLSPRQMGVRGRRGATTAASRAGLDTWLPEGGDARPYEFEYRLTVRAASITVTPVLLGTRSAVPIADALSSFSAVPAGERLLLRALSRHVPRGTPATAELRGEDAAEVLSMLRGRSVLLEPASKELRFAEGELEPKLELDLANGSNGPSLRIRVVFEQGIRKFALSSGAWFEGTPCWHIDTTEGVARQLCDAVTPAWLQRLYRSPALVQPMEQLPMLLGEYIPRVCASLGAELPDLSSVADIMDAPPRFEIRAGGDIVEARVKLKVGYEDYVYDVPPTGFPSPLSFQGNDSGEARPRVVRRDVGAEMLAVQALTNLGFEPDEDGEGLVLRGDGAIDFWTRGIGELPEEWDRFIPSDLVGVHIHDSSVAPRARVSSGVDWLSLDMVFEVGGVAVDEAELKACLEKGRSLVKLEDGSYAPIQADEVNEILERMAEIYAGAQGKDKISLSQAGRVQDLLQMVGTPVVTKAAKELFGKLEDIGEIEQIAKPRTLKATLRPYQKQGFSWLVFLHGLNTGGILADDMGLGKTVQTIALLLWLKSKAKGKERMRHLVVAPTSVVPNWFKEIEKFAPSLSAMLWHGTDRHSHADEIADHDILITSYALMRRDEEFLSAQDFYYVILDEAQHIKNPHSATAKAVKKLKSERRLALTGTPIENRLSEIWSIFDFAAPGMLGDLGRFEEKFARPIDRGDEQAAEKLRAAIHRFVLRRNKIDVAKDLPPKIEQDIVVPLAEGQSKLYQQILKQVRDSVMNDVEKQGVAKTQIQILAALTRLRQVACDPRLMKIEGEFDDELSGKLAALREIMQEAVAGGHRVLIFSQFVEMLKLIRTMLDEEDIQYEYLTGSTTDRMERVEHFNDDESIAAFLISLKAGGTGLNLVGADTVVHFDPWWNPAVEDQATDRAHRIGQTKTVSVYRLIARGTVEEKILQLSAKKRALVSNVLSTDAPLRGLTKADIDDLFS